MKPRLVGIEAARATLKDLCAAAARGEEVVITRRGRPIARVVGVEGRPGPWINEGGYATRVWPDERIAAIVSMTAPQNPMMMSGWIVVGRKAGDPQPCGPETGETGMAAADRALGMQAQDPEEVRRRAFEANRPVPQGER